MGVVKCPACGGMVSELAAACPHCGQPMAKRCPKCGNKNIAPISGLKKGASAYMFGIFAANIHRIILNAARLADILICSVPPDKTIFPQQALPGENKALRLIFRNNHPAAPDFQ